MKQQRTCKHCLGWGKITHPEQILKAITCPESGGTGNIQQKTTTKKS